ncbi:solute carrier family 25 member 45 [Amia ocellicauda]|uniref:solute carrier family 25 member 45 n=1 Tax=Amia ocellicauda TaxID=2972642 RepID=UPI003464C6EB
MPAEEFVAGWISGAVGLIVGHPMDTVKVRLQTQSTYRGIVDCVIRTYQYEGISGFFKGMAFPVLTIAISNSVAFGTYSNALDYLMQSQRSDRGSAPSSLAVYLAGCLAGAAQVVVMAPVDLVKVRLQNQTEGCRGEGRYRGPVHCVASILRQEGPRGLFRGMGALALRDVPCYGLYFLPYEVICTALTKPGQETGPLAVAFAGGTAGVVTWGCATPMDVVKARLQMDGQGGRQYRGVLHCVVASVRAEGVAVLFRGLLLNSLRAFPVNAITFLSYESLLRAMTSAH